MNERERLIAELFEPLRSEGIALAAAVCVRRRRTLRRAGMAGCAIGSFLFAYFSLPSPPVFDSASAVCTEDTYLPPNIELISDQDLIRKLGDKSFLLRKEHDRIVAVVFLDD